MAEVSTWSSYKVTCLLCARLSAHRRHHTYHYHGPLSAAANNSDDGTAETVGSSAEGAVDASSTQVARLLQGGLTVTLLIVVYI